VIAVRAMLRSKIHRAHVTDSNINYEGSITIDRKLMEAADILPYEQVDVVNVNNGARFTTYAIEGEQGEICVNGAAARLALRGDIVIILCYHQVAEEEARRASPRLVYVNADNAIVEAKRGHRLMTVLEAQ
jgi:aspartate 1-decarboxylase